MRKRWFIVAAVAVLALALFGGLALARPLQEPASSAYVVKAGQASGGGYRLAGQAWHVGGATAGDGYSLQGLGRPLQGPGCCCTMVPCVFKPW